MPSDPTPSRHARLQAWTACQDLTVAVYRATAGWSGAEDQPLADAAREAARTASLTIMLGANGARQHFRPRLEDAVGHLARLESALQLARERGRLSPSEATELEIQRDHAIRLTNGLARSLGRGGAKRRVSAG